MFGSDVFQELFWEMNREDFLIHSTAMNEISQRQL